MTLLPPSFISIFPIPNCSPLSSSVHPSRFRLITSATSTSESQSTPPSPNSPSLPHHDHIRHLATSSWGIHLDPSNRHLSNVSIINSNPLLLRHSSLLSPSDCASLISLQSSNAQESSLYLNYRVNQAVSTSSSSTSEESSSLINATELSSNSTLNSGSLSGFRTAVSDTSHPTFQTLLSKVRDFLGFEHVNRHWHMSEELWIRPNNTQIILRDATTVHYHVGEGVAPHVDGKDLTVLLCLQAPQQGGQTTFTTERISVTPVVGTALFYCSKKHMPHFAQPVQEGEKWVLQMLIDYKIREDDR